VCFFLLLLQGIGEFGVYVLWEAEEGSFSLPDSEQKSDCNEQAINGGEWPFAVASFSCGV